MSEAEERLRSSLANALIRFGESSESEQEYLAKAMDILSDEIDKLEERMIDAGYMEEYLGASEANWQDPDYDDDDDEDEDFGLFDDESFTYESPKFDLYGDAPHESGDDDFEDY